MSTKTLLPLALSFLASLPAFAGNEPFKTEVACTGIYNPGDTVIATLEVEDRVFQSHAIDFEVTLSVPGRGTRTLAQGSYVISPNQQSFIDRRLRLPLSTPAGRYTITVTGASATYTHVDTCSFHVN